jgi:hypothetical protein
MKNITGISCAPAPDDSVGTYYFMPGLGPVALNYTFEPSSCYGDSITFRIFERSDSIVADTYIRIPIYVNPYMGDGFDVTLGGPTLMELFNGKKISFRTASHKFLDLSRITSLTKLKECNFSFYNVDPYKADENGQPTAWSDDWLISQLETIDVSLGEQLIESGFYGSLPFRLSGNVNLYDIYSDDSTNNAYANSHISVTIETLFDYGESDFHTTEKTFKPIVYKKPFIMFSSHLFLKNLRKMGYATFHPYIDETYDTIEDPKLRADAVVAEMQRISNLSEEDFNQLMLNCQERVEWNFNRLSRRYDNFYYGVNIDPYIEWTMCKQR